MKSRWIKFWSTTIILTTASISVTTFAIFNNLNNNSKTNYLFTNKNDYYFSFLNSDYNLLTNNSWFTVKSSNSIQTKGDRFKLASSVTEEEARKFLIIQNVDPAMVKISLEADDFWGILKIFYSIENNEFLSPTSSRLTGYFIIENYFSIFWTLFSLIIVISFIITIIIFAILINKKNRQKYKNDLKKYRMQRLAVAACKQEIASQKYNRNISHSALEAKAKSNVLTNNKVNYQNNNISFKQNHTTNKKSFSPVVVSKPIIKDNKHKN